MKPTPITTSCRSCNNQVDGAMHVMLCDRCLEAHVVRLERTSLSGGVIPAGRSLGSDRVRSPRGRSASA